MKVVSEDIRARSPLRTRSQVSCSVAGRRSPRCNDPAVILFTSGSEGAPKALSSPRNILANVARRYAHRSGEIPFSTPALFHSFGLTVGLIMPLIAGAPVFLPVAPALPNCSRARLSDERDNPFRHGYIPQRLCARRAPLRSALRQACSCRGRGGEAVDARPLHGKIRRSYLGRVRRHRSRTRAREQYADGQQTRHGWAPVTAHGGAARSSRRDRGWRPPIRPWSEYYARVLPRGKPGCSRAAGKWMARYRRYRIHRSPRLCLSRARQRFAKVGGEMVSLAAVEALAVELWPKAVSVVAQSLIRARASALSF